MVTLVVSAICIALFLLLAHFWEKWAKNDYEKTGGDGKRSRYIAAGFGLLILPTLIMTIPVLKRWWYHNMHQNLFEGKYLIVAILALIVSLLIAIRIERFAREMYKK